MHRNLRGTGENPVSYHGNGEKDSNENLAVTCKEDSVDILSSKNVIETLKE